MKMQGKVMALFRAIEGQEGREEAESIHIDASGIIGDKNYGKRPNRTILITSDDASYTLAKNNGISMPYGSLGENIVIDIDPYQLPAGTQLKLGETIVAITQNCTLCSSLAKVDEKLPELLKKNRGIFAKTAQGGEIKKGDRVIIL